LKYVDAFRDPAASRAVVSELASLAGKLRESGIRPAIMEVCGTHTMAIARNGRGDVLPPEVSLISGPGCPVCVTEPGYIDAAILAATRATVFTFGDMLNVPGSEDSLATARAAGADVHPCYSPSAALDFARANPARETVFLAIGFETTIAPVAALAAAAENGLPNFSMLTALKLVPPALAALVSDPAVHIDAFLCPAHVSAIIGSDAYAPFAGPGGRPCVIAGFEPLDILYGIRCILAQLADGQAFVENEYARVVKPEGNVKAQNLISRYMEPYDAAWRGIGVIPASGLRLRKQYGAMDAESRFGIRVEPGTPPTGCRCGDPLKGILNPPGCPLFDGRCTPENPVGPCMVSSEGACAAWHSYRRIAPAGKDA